jgi:hypothetical protein
MSKKHPTKEAFDIIKEDLDRIENDNDAFEKLFNEEIEAMISEGLLTRFKAFDPKSGCYEDYCALTPKAYGLDCFSPDVPSDDAGLTGRKHSTNKDDE